MEYEREENQRPRLGIKTECRPQKKSYMFGVEKVIFYLEFQNIFTKKHSSKKIFTMKAYIRINKAHVYTIQ